MDVSNTWMSESETATASWSCNGPYNGPVGVADNYQLRCSAMSRDSRRISGSWAVGKESSMQSLDTVDSKRKLLRQNTMEAKRPPASRELRAELEMRAEEQATAESRIGISFCSCRSRLGSTFEPKDMNLTELAKSKHGEHANWYELSVSEQVAIIQDELSSKHWAMNPNSDYMALWDGIVVFCLIFTAFVTPVELAFLKPGYNALYMVNRMVDVLFIKDMILQFFLQVKTHTKQGIVWLKRKKDIANAYLRSWFLLDLIAILPYDDISNIVQGGGTSTEVSRLKIVRLLRVMRLIKLVRILKAARVLKRWQTRVGLKYVSLYLVQFCVLILVSCHWMACVWGFFGMLEGNGLQCRETLPPSDPRLEEFPDRMFFIGEQELDPYDPQQWVGVSWVVSFASARVEKSPLDPCSAVSLYVASMYWAIMTMTSIGYGDIIPLTISEYLICTVCMLASSILWAYIISAACGIMMSMDPEGQEFEKRIDAFNAMASDLELPSHIRHLGREYIRNYRYHQRFMRNAKAMESCGKALKTSVAKIATTTMLSEIWFLKQASIQLKSDIVRAMQPQFYERRVVVKQPGKLCVVEHGCVGRAGRVLVPWNYWGDDILMFNKSLRLEKLCSTLAYTELVVLSREDLSVVLLDYPDELGFLRRCAACVATVRISYIYRQQQLRIRTLPQDLEWIRGIFDRARVVGQSHLKEIARQCQLKEAARHFDLDDDEFSRQNSVEAQQACEKHIDGVLGEVACPMESRLEIMQDQLTRMEEMVRSFGFGLADDSSPLEKRHLISL